MYAMQQYQISTYVQHQQQFMASSVGTAVGMQQQQQQQQDTHTNLQQPPPINQSSPQMQTSIAQQQSSSSSSSLPGGGVIGGATTTQQTQTMVQINPNTTENSEVPLIITADENAPPQPGPSMPIMHVIKSLLKFLAQETCQPLWNYEDITAKGKGIF